MIRFNLNRSPKEDKTTPIETTISKLLGLDIGCFEYEIKKKSLDARKGKAKFVYTIDALIHKGNEKKLAAKCKGEVLDFEEEYQFPVPKFKSPFRPVIAGFGPAGIFAALMLARSGYKPIILERGKRGEERKKDVDEFFGGGRLNPESNIQYGEGGAGAFSDGKLNTLIKDKSFRGRLVLRELVNAGAPAETLYMAKPHIGTDLLRTVVANLRDEIISLGGEIRFETRLEDIILDQSGRLSAVVPTAKLSKPTHFSLPQVNRQERFPKCFSAMVQSWKRSPFRLGSA